MCLRPDPLGEIPAETAAAARAAFRKGCLALRLRDEFGRLYADEQFAALYPRRGQPALAPWRLALVSVLQFCEGLTDEQAADAVRGRLDWKYALGLELAHPGFDASVLSEFRARVVAGGLEEELLTTLLVQCRERGLLRAGGRQRTDSTHVLAAVRQLNRLECVGETVRATLNALATAAPGWLPARLAPAWSGRYGERLAAQRLPTAAAARRALAEQIGADGLALLAAVDAEPAAEAWGWLRQVPAVQVLRRVWWQQFLLDAEGVLRWREADNLPPAGTLICSPYDSEVHYGRKRETTWLGAKVHLTESYDADAPHLVTQVTTTAASVPDGALTDPIQADLAGREVLPGQHALDAGYVDAANLVASQERGVALVGPVPPDTSWQAQAGEGFDVTGFALNWDAQTATCPGGRTSQSWTPASNRHGQPVITVAFATADCRACALRPACTRAPERPRHLTIRPQPEHEALQAARQRQAEPAFPAQYAGRAGIEGTISQGVRAYGLRRARYRGLAKLHLEHLLIATAVNLQRLWAWWTEQPLAQTRQAPFVALAAAA